MPACMRLSKLGGGRLQSASKGRGVHGETAARRGARVAAAARGLEALARQHSLQSWYITTVCARTRACVTPH